MRKLSLRRWVWTLAVLVGATVPLSGGAISLNSTMATKTDLGSYAGGTVLGISISGTVSLNGDGIDTHPDGSMSSVPPNTCAACWAPGYEYFKPGANYPSGYGGNGVNQFPGGGGNYDLYPSFNLGLSYFAQEGARTTDTTNANVMRFGAVAGTWSANPTPNSADWFLVGYGGNFTVPSGGAHLYLIVVDTYYANNAGSYSVAAAPVSGPSTPVAQPIATVPEPGVAWLMTGGLLLLGASAGSVRRRKPVGRESR